MIILEKKRYISQFNLIQELAVQFSLDLDLILIHF